VDPEYAVTQEVTPKSDVYSYGVLLLELVTGKPVVQEDSNRSLVEWSRELIGTDCRLHELVDPAVAGAFDLDELQVVADVIHWCTHRDGAARPSMKQVLRILHERLDPLSGRFARAVEGEEGYYYCQASAGGGGWRAKGKLAGGEVVQFSGEAVRSWLPSSSSTSRSHCSRSVLLECSSPDEQRLSPPAAAYGGNGAFLA
jgi:serine/threonine protein kinase